jgi:hypothetical protein
MALARDEAERVLAQAQSTFHLEEAKARQEGREVRLRWLQDFFPQKLSEALELIARRRKILKECDAESRQFGFPQVARNRLSAMRSQIMGEDGDELRGALDPARALGAHGRRVV